MNGDVWIQIHQAWLGLYAAVANPGAAAEPDALGRALAAGRLSQRLAAPAARVEVFRAVDRAAVAFLYYAQE